MKHTQDKKGMCVSYGDATDFCQNGSNECVYINRCMCTHFRLNFFLGMYCFHQIQDDIGACIFASCSLVRSFVRSLTISTHVQHIYIYMGCSTVQCMYLYVYNVQYIPALCLAVTLCSLFPSLSLLRYVYRAACL